MSRLPCPGLADAQALGNLPAAYDVLEPSFCSTLGLACILRHLRHRGEVVDFLYAVSLLNSLFVPYSALL